MACYDRAARAISSCIGSWTRDRHWHRYACHSRCRAGPALPGVTDSDHNTEALAASEFKFTESVLLGGLPGSAGQPRRAAGIQPASEMIAWLLVPVTHWHGKGDYGARPESGGDSEPSRTVRVICNRD